MPRHSPILESFTAPLLEWWAAVWTRLQALPVNSIASIRPVPTNSARAMARENKDYETAERELKQAIAASAHPAFQWMRLASFYRKTKRWTEMENAVQSGLAAAQHDSHAGVALFNGASVLIKANRNPSLAIKLLEAYLASLNGYRRGDRRLRLACGLRVFARKPAMPRAHAGNAPRLSRSRRNTSPRKI